MKAGEVGRAGSSMVEPEGIVEVNVMIGDMIGEVRISVGMGNRRSCWFWVSEWTVVSDVDGDVGVSTWGGSLREVVVPLLVLPLGQRSGCLYRTCVLPGLLVPLLMSLFGLPAGHATCSGTSKLVCFLGCLACRPNNRLGMVFPFC